MSNQLSTTGLALIMHQIAVPDNWAATMANLESVVSGVLLTVEFMEQRDAQYTDKMIMALEDGVRKRIAELRKDGKGVTAK